MDFDIYIDSWIISDANYEYFREGESREFALESMHPTFDEGWFIIQTFSGE